MKKISFGSIWNPKEQFMFAQSIINHYISIEQSMPLRFVISLALCSQDCIGDAFVRLV